VALALLLAHPWLEWPESRGDARKLVLGFLFT
jgi:hypothetical protein